MWFEKKFRFSHTIFRFSNYLENWSPISFLLLVFKHCFSKIIVWFMVCLLACLVVNLVINLRNIWKQKKKYIFFLVSKNTWNTHRHRKDLVILVFCFSPDYSEFSFFSHFEFFLQFNSYHHHNVFSCCNIL